MPEEIKQTILETPTQYAMRQDVVKILKIVEELKSDVAKIKSVPPASVEMSRGAGGQETWTISLRGSDMAAIISTVKAKHLELCEAFPYAKNGKSKAQRDATFYGIKNKYGGKYERDANRNNL